MVSGLTKGETYVFRVQAINELGLSEESQESSPLTVKAALSQYYIIYLVIQIDNNDHNDDLLLRNLSLLGCDDHF